jgi:hypothetical protein
LRGARFSADSVQYIGCSRTAWGDGSSVFSCYARDATGANRVCQTTDPNMIRSGQAQSPTSHLHFTIGTDGSTCERVHTNSYSSYMSTTP